MTLFTVERDEWLGEGRVAEQALAITLCGNLLGTCTTTSAWRTRD
ncbi:hypothetical protein ACYF6T_09235 [Streptomyces sp. 7R007]